MAAVALLLPVASMWKLQPSIVASFPNAYDYRQEERTMMNLWNSFKISSCPPAALLSGLSPLQ